MSTDQPVSGAALEPRPKEISAPVAGRHTLAKTLAGLAVELGVDADAEARARFGRPITWLSANQRGQLAARLERGETVTRERRPRGPIAAVYSAIIPYYVLWALGAADPGAWRGACQRAGVTPEDFLEYQAWLATRRLDEARRESLPARDEADAGRELSNLRIANERFGEALRTLEGDVDVRTRALAVVAGDVAAVAESAGLPAELRDRLGRAATAIRSLARDGVAP